MRNSVYATYITQRTTKYGGQCARLEIKESLLRTLQDVLRVVSLGKTLILTAQYWYNPDKKFVCGGKASTQIKNTKKS